MHRVPFALLSLLASVSLLYAQGVSPGDRPLPPKAIYTPAPVYRPEWARQGLAGKGVVLVTIDTQTGKVTGARMATSTGNKQLDGAALEAFSQWRFQPGGAPQLKMPIEFAARANPKPPQRSMAQPFVVILFLIVAGMA